jgi:hypothetical protein
MSQWQRPETEVALVERDGAVSLIGLRLPKGLTPPLAPASLWINGHAVVDLDWVVGSDDDTTVFRTMDDMPSDLLGRTVEFQQWWTPDQLALVTDTWRPWARVTELPDGSPDFCRLGWEPAETEGGPVPGWVSGSDWICDQCHDSYIARDRLGVRD